MKNYIKIQRAKHNLTQAALAEKVQVSRQTIHAIEIGKFIPSTLLALKMATIFQCKLEEIFILEENDWK